MSRPRTSRRVLVTGASGFVGQALVPALRSAGWQVRATGRDASRRPADCEFLAVDLAARPSLADLVREVDAVVHLASRAHVMNERSADPLAEFRRANVAPTASLAEAARAAGVRHFVLASSIKVNGEETPGAPFAEGDAPRPADPYAASKLEAENALRACAGERFCATILRPPLMYGAAAKGNFGRLVRAVERGVPLPLASVDNRRSLLFVGNFSSAVSAALGQPRPGARLYLLADDEAVSTPELVRRIARCLGAPARLFPCPVPLLHAAARCTGFGAETKRLLGSLVVDPTRIREELGWTPPYALDQGLALSLRASASPSAAGRGART